MKDLSRPIAMGFRATLGVMFAATALLIINAGGADLDLRLRLVLAAVALGGVALAAFAAAKALRGESRHS